MLVIYFPLIFIMPVINKAFYTSEVNSFAHQHLRHPVTIFFMVIMTFVQATIN